MRRFALLAAVLRVAAPALCLVVVLASPSRGDPPVDLFKPWESELTQFGAHYGTAVATAGDVNGDGYSDFIVGAPEYDNGAANQGRVFVYLGSSSQFLSQTPAWTAEGSQPYGLFGRAVASAGDVNGDGFGDVIVGARYLTNGQAVVYLGSGSGLGPSPAWTAEGDRVGALFGTSVATAGDVNGDGFSDVIVGEVGRASVYLGSASGLGTTPAWSAVSDLPGDLFGASVASAGDVNGDGYADVIVGAPNYPHGQSTVGRALVYLGSASGVAAAPAWSVEGDQQGASLGISVSTAGDVNGDGYADVIVGAHLYDGAVVDGGRASIYLGSAAGPSAQPVWSGGSDQTNSGFGFSVGAAGDVNGDGYADVIVGACGYDLDPVYLLNSGAAFLYFGSATGPVTTTAFLAARQQHDEGVGYFVAPAGDVNADGYSDFIVGGPYYDWQDPNTGITYGGSDVGRATLWVGSPSGPTLAAGWSAEGDQQAAHFGASTSTAGDVNGDGFSDLIVGAPYFDDGQPDEGRAFAYFGSSSGLATVPAWAVESDQAGARFGSSVGSAGDVNGDGYADVIVGAPFYDHGEIDEGRAYLYLGSAAGLSTTAATTLESDQAGAHFGASVATAGDVNGDGFSDVLVGAPEFDNGQTDEGRVFLFLGSSSGLVATPAWMAESDQAGAAMGFSVGSAGDVNRDGYSDVIVGAPYFDDGQSDEGRVSVYLGSPSGLDGGPVWMAERNQGNALFGVSVGTAGDVNGDGYSDVIVGANHFDDWQSDEGLAFVYYGSATGPAATPAWVFGSDQISAELGRSVATAGDINADGYSDIVVGAYLYDHGEPDEGRVYVFLGSASGLGRLHWTGEGDQAGALFGAAVGTAGDVNGDGYCDLVVGAHYFDGGEFDEGKVFLYLGSGGGLPRLPRQYQPDGSAAIAPLGKSISTAFRIGALGRSPSGRGRVRMEWEAKPLGEPFDASGHGIGPAIDTGAPIPGIGSVASLGALVHGLAAETPYHWRFRLVTDSPSYPYSPWLSPATNGAAETDLRTGNSAVGVPEPAVRSVGLRVEMIRPNPSSSQVVIRYSLPRAGRGQLWIQDLQGRRVALLLDGVQTAGAHTAAWDGRDQNGKQVGSGIYWARLRSDGEAAARKFVRE